MIVSRMVMQVLTHDLLYGFSRSSEYSNYDFTKFLEPVERQGLGSLLIIQEIPIMRLSEIYYIACEAQIGKDNALALQYLNDVRNNRNLYLIQLCLMMLLCWNI